MADKRFVKGLFKDTTYLDQPEGSWRYALNAIMQDKDGTITNETGNTPDGQIGGGLAGENMLCIGHVEVDNDKVILFLRDRRDDGSTLYESAVATWIDGTFTYIYKPDPTKHNLNFNKNYPIEGTFKIDSSGDLVVYFTDDLNPPRALNITRQEASLVTRLYSLPVALGSFGAGINTSTNRTHKNHIDLLNLFPNAGPVPHIDLDFVGPIQSSVVTGGGLRTGVYYLALAYVDVDNVATNYVTVSNPVSIVDEYDFTAPAFRKDGAKDGSQTSKSIKWLVSNINNDYSLVRPAIVRKMGGVTEAVRLPDIDAQVASTDGITYSGLEEAETSAVEDILIDTIAYDTAKTINQLDGVLYLGNLTRTLDLGYQPYANNIKLNSVVKSIENFDTFYATVDNLETGFGTQPIDNGNPVDPSKSYRFAPNIFKYKGYMRDEVYAFYLAFILKDGSMSYAYHIPGREAIDDELDPPSGSGIRSDLAGMSSFAANFHFLDNSINSSTTTQMNYWHNSTEFYPLTDNFLVKDGLSNGTPLQGKNVRHHHFPSNENSERKTIAGNVCSTLNSLGTTQAQQVWNGRLVCIHHNDGGENEFPGSANWDRSFDFSDKSISDSAVYDAQGNIVTGAAFTALISSTNSGKNNRFTADQPMSVAVRYNVWGYKQHNSGTTGYSKLRRSLAGTTSDGCDDSVGNWGGCGCGNIDWFTSKSNCGNSGWTFNMQTGDWVEGRGKGNGSGSSRWRQAKQSEAWPCQNPCGNSATPSGQGGWITQQGTRSWFQVNMTSGTSLTNTLTDAIISHDINILGFELEDIKIPRDIADKVQGFRIYYAKRKHADKRILGQDFIKPMDLRKEIIGICREAGGSNAAQASQILGTLQDEKEIFYSKRPWASAKSSFPSIAIESKNNYQNIVTDNAYQIFSAHDFNLLRTHNSIAGLTHIKPEYLVENYVFNGPTTNQDKRMNTTLLNYGSTTDPVEINEKWGYDEDMNCYPKEVYTGIFFGGRYLNFTFHSNQPLSIYGMNSRILGQKSKTYLHGDSIFDATALGFGGKIFNEFGETALIFGLMQGHELVALPNTRFAGTGDPQDDWGVAHLAAPSILLTPTPIMTNLTPYNHANRSMNYLVNLHAFRTDMYKSIDSQELVWTGFEVIGDDLDNFTFEADGTSTGDFKTKTIQEEGIFGGDTFITRYGVAMGLKPSDPSEDSNPLRSIFHNLVESVDNINFRHAESALSNYFPATSAKEMLKYVGTSSGTESDGAGENSGDFTAQDNMKYNSDYSALNDVRPAIPLPLKDNALSDFPTRTHRSAKADTSSVIDNYRMFLANQFKDLPKNRGDLWKLATFNNLLYFHMVDSLFAAKGKQTMQMKDGSEASVGSGDIFQQDPDELVQTQDGHGGTQSQWAALTTRAGYFFVDRSKGKVFLMQDKLQEISNTGLETWFRENLGSDLDTYGAINQGACSVLDNPILGLGLTSVYDPKYKRIILTKRDLKPTAAFITGWNKPNSIPPPNGKITWDANQCTYKMFQSCIQAPPPAPPCQSYINLSFDDTVYFEKTGWTISYFPELAIWTSFHDYIPYKYFNTSKTFYSFTDRYSDYLNGIISTQGVNSVTGVNDPSTAFGNSGIWKHNEGLRGVLYQEQNSGLTSTRTVYPFEFEAIHNELKQDAVFYNFTFTADVYDEDNNLILDAGFTSFYVFNTFQISGDKTSSLLEYLVNIRRIGNNWNVNKFRDLAALSVDSSAYYTPATANVAGNISTGTLTTSSIVPMFTLNGMVETPTAAYMVLPPVVKPFFQRKKFIDKWMGIRLIYNNISNNLINLHSTAVGAKKLHR
tara:strand:- start:5245 stop:10686 length:5442 start_codon:yes stop_codon:yes gene_type:complete